MENISFALILFLLGSLLPLSVHGAPGGTVPTDENKSIEETTTEVAVSLNETVTENNSSSTNDCPTGWWFLEENCYFFGKKERSFEKAQNFCMDMNSTLFEPKNLKTNDLVFEKAKNVSERWGSQYKFFWIGIHDLNNEGNFTYVSDQNETVIPWDNWNEGEPNNFKNGEDCVYSHDHGKWNDMNCTAKSEFICEKPANGPIKIFSNFRKKNSNDTEKSEESSISTTTTENPSTTSNSNVEITSVTIENVTKSVNSSIEETTESLVQSDTPTASPYADSTRKSERRFDGWSFFGGIILTIGIAVISFFGTKYYKSRRMTTENYSLM